MKKGIKVKKSKPEFDFISSGCAVLDCTLGGGFPLGRISNVVGDKSSGKTLLAMEACANFAFKYPKGQIIYHESESAFNFTNAEAIGVPLDKVHFIENVFTIGGLFTNLLDVVKKELHRPKFYVLDSLDALESSEEIRCDFDESGFHGARRAERMSSLFRKLTSNINKSQTHFMVLSQLRDKIGAMFGEKQKRSGGRAMDFYASQVLWLHDTGGIVKTKRGIKKIIGRRVRARCKKNKVGLPLRECEFPILYRYGINDIEASINYLSSVDNGLDGIKLPMKKNKDKKIVDIDKAFEVISGDDKLRDSINIRTIEVWNDIEDSFMPRKGKYKGVEF